MVKYKFILLIMTFVGHKKELQMHCLAAIQMYHELDDSKSPVSSEFLSSEYLRGLEKIFLIFYDKLALATVYRRK